MAIIQCPECGKEVSDKAGNCPHCGFGVKQYMEDEENLSKASSKIVKSRHEEEEAMEELQHD